MVKFGKFFKKFLLAATVLTLSLTQFAAAGSAASTTEKLTVTKYVSYLKEEAKKDEDAQKVLNKFQNLDEEEQQKFVEFLDSPEYLSALTIDEDTTTTIKDVPVRVKKTDSVSKLASGSTTKSGKFTLSVFGIDTTWLSVTVLFSYNSYGDATKVSDAYGTYKNYNPALIMSAQGAASKDIVNDLAYGHQIFETRLSSSLGFVVDTWHVYVLGHRDDDASWKKLESTHMNFDDEGEGMWTKL